MKKLNHSAKMARPNPSLESVRCSLFGAIKKIVLLIAIGLIFLGHGYAALMAEPKTWFTLKLTAEAGKEVSKFRYSIKMPEKTNFSYYLGSDLPQWQWINNNKVRGIFRAENLVNIRVHPKSDQIQFGTVYLSVMEGEKIVWKGKLIYSGADRPVKIISEFDNKPVYATKVYFQKDMPTVWFETKKK